MMTSYWMLMTWVVTLLPWVTAFPNGPPVTIAKYKHLDVCTNMNPEPGHNVSARKEGNPFSIHLTTTCYSNMPVPVHIKLEDNSQPYFEGFFVMARQVLDGNIITTNNEGDFTADDEDVKMQPCYRKQNSAVSHRMAEHWLCKKFYWNPPTDGTARKPTIVFQGTIVRNEKMFWIDRRSVELTYDANCAQAAALSDAECDTAEIPSVHTRADPLTAGSDVTRACVLTWIGALMTLLLSWKP